MKNEFALAVEQMRESERQGKGTLPVESCSGDNCGDALANFLNSGPLKDTGLALPRGGVGPGDLAGVGKARGASVLGKGDLSLDNLTPGTVIHMTRQPGDRNYKYGSTHIGIVDEDEQGNKMFKSFTAGKGWRTEAVDQRFIDRLPAQITATNPVNPGGSWLAKAGNLLGPSAAQAGGLPTVNNLRAGEAEDEISRAVRESSGTQVEEDEITKAVRESSGVGEVTTPAPAPVVPTPAESVVSYYGGFLSAGLPSPGVEYDELGVPVPQTRSVMMSDARLSELESQSTNIPESAVQDFAKQFPRLVRPESKPKISARRESDPWRIPELVRGESIWSRTPHQSIQPDPPSWGELAVSVINLQDVAKSFGVGEAEASPVQDPSWRVASDDPAIRRPPVRQEVIKAAPPDLTIENIAKKFATGVIGTTGSTAEGLRWLLSDTSPALEQAKPILAGLARSADQYSKFLDPGDVGILGDVASGVGSFGVFFIPGYGSAILTSKTAQFLTPRVAKALGIGIMTAGEAMAEAGDAWAEATRYGAAKEQADLIAGRVFNFNLPLLAITERLGIFGEQGNKLRRVIASGIMEGIQETGQSMIPQVAAEKPIQYKSALYQGLIGAVIGTAAGGATSGINGEPQRIDKFMDSVSPGNLADRAKAELVDIWKKRNPNVMGYSDEEVFERLARDPKELSDILITAVQRTGPTIETALRKPTVEEIVANVQVAGEEAVKKAEVVEEVPVIEEPKPKPLTAVERARAKKAKEVKVEGEVVPEPTPEPKPTPKPKVVPTPPERTVIETDPQTSSLRQDPEVTRVRTQAFDERAPRDLLSIHAKALNDVNRWLDGDPEVSIDQVRRLLSDLAAKVEDPANDRVMLDMLGTPREVEMFKKISKESATWARRVKREKGEKAPKVDIVPEVVVKEPAPKVNNLPSIEQKLEAPKVAEGEVKELADNEAWKQAEVDAKVAEDTRLTQQAIEKYYGKSLDELSDAEVISYMNKELLGKGGGTELYSGIPIHLIGKAIRNFFGKKEELPSHEDFKLAMGAKKPDGKYQWKVLGLNSKTGKWDELSVFDTKKEARTNSIQRSVDASVEWTKMYREKMNDPLMQPEAAAEHKRAERAKRNQDAMREFKEGDFTKWWDSRKKFLGEMIHDRAGRVRSALLKHFGEGGQRLLSYTESVAGGPRYGEEKASQMRREVEAGLSKEMLKNLFDYHMYTRYMDIWKDHPKWKVPTREGEIAPKQKEIVSIMANFKVHYKLSDAEFKLIQERSELMFEHMRNWIDDSLLASGIIGQKEANDLKDHRYTKMKALRTWTDVFDKESIYQVGDQKTVNYDSGIQRIKGGGLPIVETDQFLVYTEVARMLFGRAANQRSRQAMREFATQFPDNNMIWHKGMKGKQPKGWVKDYVFDFEKPVESVETSYPTRQPIWLHPDFAHQVTTVGYEMSARFSSVAGKIFGGDLVRALAVGISPVWATIVNLPIDILHTFFSPRIFKDGKEVGKSNAEAIFSPFFPKYLAELGSNYIDVASDVWNRGPKYQAYARYGGLLQFLTQRQSHVTGQMKRPGKFDELLDILSAHGRNTELLTRLAIMDRVVEQKADELGMTKEALWKRENARPESEILRLATHVARENMPYGQTGWMIKALDRFIPFMGANYVGGKTFWRAAIERPGDFATRISNIGAAAVGITAMSLLYNPEAWREIPDWDRERNVCIPFLSDYLKFKDSNGEKRTWHMKIPGTGGPMFFYNLFSWLTHKFMYDSGMTKIQPDYSIIPKSVLQNAPAQTMTPPIVSALLSYTKNMSFWQDRNIFTKLGGKVFSWPGSSVEGMNDSDVSQLAKDVGGLTRFSPKRLQDSFSEIVPTGNEFIWLGGKIYEGLFNSMPEKLMERTWQETITKSPGFKRLFGLSFPGAYRQVGDEARWKQQEKVDMRDYVRRSEFDKIMEEREKGGEVRDKLRTFYREVGREDKDARDRFNDEADQLRTIERLPNKSLWKGMLNKSNELKAMDYYERMKIESSPEEQASLRKELRILEDAGFISDEFHDELRRLRRKDKK